jgi:hypothetical protein
MGGDLEVKVGNHYGKWEEVDIGNQRILWGLKTLSGWR